MRRNHRAPEQGFSMLEMLIVVAILTVVLGLVFRYINNAQRVYRTQENRIDTTQQAREAIDEITRELHQSGFPSAQLYAPGVLGNPSANDSRAAVGLVKVSPTELWFEGDINNDGNVYSVHYLLNDSTGNAITGASTCPCSLQRGTVPKANATAPMAQAVTYASAINNILNSGGAAALGAPLALTGNTAAAGGAGAATANDVLYAAFKNAQIFTAYDASGNVVTLPTDILNSPTRLATVRTIQISLNLEAHGQGGETNVLPVIPMMATVKLNN
jgi:prepilin-type N-terminal cleavage/methylation domain-containing protein